MKSLLVNVIFVLILLMLTVYQISHRLPFSRIYIFWVPIALLMLFSFTVVGVRSRASQMARLADRLGGVYSFAEGGEANTFPKAFSFSHLFVRANRNFVTIKSGQKTIKLFDTPRPIFGLRSAQFFSTTIEINGMKSAEYKRWLFDSDNTDSLYTEAKKLL